MAKKKKIEWTKIQVKLGDIDAWEDNPKYSTKEQARRIVESEEAFGQPLPFVLEPEKKKRYPLIDGHQRKAAWESVHGSEFLVDAVVSSRKLTLKEKKKFIIYFHASATGSFDWDKLSSWDAEDLIGWGMDKAQLDITSLDFASLKELLLSSGVIDEQYTAKIQVPVYEPSPWPPDISELYDEEKYLALVSEIKEAAFLSTREEAFLIAAASRHIVFDFHKIADFYASSSPELQELMENSALVILDFEKAVQLGFVQLTKKVIKMMREAYGDE